MPGNEEVSQIGVRLVLDASNFMDGMGAATGELRSFQQSAAGGRAGGPGGAMPVTRVGTVGTPANGRAGTAAVGIDVNRSQFQRNLRAATQGLAAVPIPIAPKNLAGFARDITRQIGTVPITVAPQLPQAGKFNLSSVIGNVLSMQYGITPQQGRHLFKQTIESRMGPLPKGMWRGGPVHAGQGVVVGERRPELFRPGASGFIEPDVAHARKMEAELAALEEQIQERRKRLEDAIQSERDLRGFDYAANRRMGGRARRQQGGPTLGNWIMDWRKQPNWRDAPLVENVSLETLLRLRTHDRETMPRLGLAEGRQYLDELTEKIRTEGFNARFPVAIQYDPYHDTAFITDGNHRIAVGKRLGLRELPTAMYLTQVQHPKSRGTRLGRAPFIMPNEYGYIPGRLPPSWAGIRAQGGPAKAGGLPRGLRMEFWGRTGEPGFNRIGGFDTAPWSPEADQFGWSYLPHHISNYQPLKKPVFPPQGGQNWPGAFTAAVFDREGKIVGLAPFNTQLAFGHPYIQPKGTWVDEKWRRRGIASAMYNKAERFSGATIIPDDIQTEEGAALWQSPRKTWGKEPRLRFTPEGALKLSTQSGGGEPTRVISIRKRADGGDVRAGRVWHLMVDGVPGKIRGTEAEVAGWIREQAAAGHTIKPFSGTWVDTGAPTGIPSHAAYIRKRARGGPAGFDFKAQRFGEMLRVDAFHTETGEHAGDVEFEQYKPGPYGERRDIPSQAWYPTSVLVRPKYQRKGVASWMYATAEKELGEPVFPSDIQGPGARAMWANPNRPFGPDTEGMAPGQMGMFAPTRRWPHRPRGGDVLRWKTLNRRELFARMHPESMPQMWRIAPPEAAVGPVEPGFVPSRPVDEGFDASILRRLAEYNRGLLQPPSERPGYALPNWDRPERIRWSRNARGGRVHAWRGATARAYERTLALGGGTFPVDPRTAVPTSGHALGISKFLGAESYHVPTDDPVAFMRAFHKQKRAGAPFVGTWVDPDTGLIDVDPSTVIANKRLADMVLRFGGEKAAYDIAREEPWYASTRGSRMTAAKVAEIIYGRRRADGGRVKGATMLARYPYETMVKNIEMVAEGMTPGDIAVGNVWYGVANRLIRRAAEFAGYKDINRGLAAMAATSPQMRLISNLAHTTALMQGAMRQQYPTKADADKLLPMLGNWVEQELGPGHLMLPRGVMGLPGREGQRGWGILTSGQPIEDFLRGPKVVPFHGNLSGNLDLLTLDSLASQIATAGTPTLNRRAPGRATSPEPGIFRDEMARAYHTVFKKPKYQRLFEHVAQFQAGTWTRWRGAGMARGGDVVGMPRIGMDFAGSPLGRAYPKAYMKSDATWENFMNPVYPMDFQRAMYVVRYGLLNKVKARPSAAGGPATMGAAGMGVLEVMRQWALDPYMAMMTWQALQDKTRGRAGGGEVEKAIEAVKYAHSVRRGFEPTFSSERSGYPATGEPDSFLRRTTRYAEYRGYRTRQPAFRSYDIGYFDREGALSGIFSMAVGGEQGGAFKIAVDPEKQRQGIGTRLLEEAERHGVDFTKYAGMNSYTPQGRALMLAFLQKKLGRALGGHPDEGGMYIVGEIGKELFVPNRLRHLIPKRVMDQIPHAKGGMQVIGKRPNELFFPPEDGIIVPNRLMDQVIPHAARGKRARKGERLFRETPVGQYEEIEPYDLGALNPLAPVTIPARRTETTPGFSMETMAAPLQRALSPVAAAIMTARAVRPTPAPRPAPAAAAPVEVAGPPAPPPPPAPTPTLGAQQPGETYEQYARRLQEAVMARPMAYTPPPPRATRAAAGGGQTLAELGLTPEDLKGIGSSRGALSLGDVVGRGAGAGEAETAGNEALANLRGTLTEMTSGMSAWQQMMSGRTPRGLIAQISSMMGGRGGMFELQQQARTQARALRGTLAQPEFTPEMATGLQNYIELQAKLPGVRGKEREAIQKQIDGYRNAEGPLGKAVKQTDDLTKTMQKLQPTTAGIVKNLGTIIAATSAYGMAMQAANAVIQPALDGVQRGVADLGNQFLDFSPTVTAVSKGMAETLTQTHGNYQQVLAQLGMGAGMNAGLLANVGGALQTQAYAKAGGTAAGQQQQAVRAAMGAAGAPSGLFGGYGGVLGTQFLASELGGGKGFTEQMGATYGDLVANIAKNQRVATSGVIAMGGRAGGIRADTSQVAAAQKQMAADIKTQSEWITSQTKAAERGAQAMGDAANIVTFEVVPKDSDLAKQAEAAANAAHDSAMAGAAQAGLIMKVNGHIASSTEEYTKAVSQWAAGLTITPPDVWAQGMQRQLTAQLQMTAAQTQRAQALQIPYGVTQQLLVQPLQRPGAAFVPGAARGAPNVAALGVSQGVAATVTAGMSATGRYQQELRTLAQQGFNAQIANIRQNIDKGVAGYYHGGQSGIGAAEAQFRTLYASATNLSTSIANVTANMNALNAEAARASWANQIRLAGRSLQDALGTIRGYTGRGAAGSQFGRLEGAMQKLAFALQAREIATARAVAQFQAPGQTGEERYMQQKEALAKAAIAQQQLTNQQQVYAINIGRAVTDTNAAIGVMTKARDAEINALAAQDRINAAEAVLATKVQSMATLTGQADQNWQTITGAALSGISDFSGALDDGIKAVYKALGYKVTTNPQTGTNTFTQVGNAPFAQQGSSFALKAFTDALGAAGAGGAPTDRKGGKQTGFLGTISSPTSMTVGEAGAETVAVLRNPRTTDIAPQGGGGGPMNFSITINYSGGGSPQDAAALARQVADEVERRMSRKGQMLGLRAPAY